MKLKEFLRQKLSEEDYKALVSMVPEHGGKVANGLIGFLADTDEQRKWAAVRALGLVTARLYSLDPERAKRVLRQLIWNLNDESGGIGWGMAEAFGEILAVIPALRKEYAGLLAAYISEERCFIENEEIQKGVIWGLGRIGLLEADIKDRIVPFLLHVLQKSKPETQGLAAWAIGEMQIQEAVAHLKNLQIKNQMLKIYTGTDLKEKSLNQWIEEALTKLSKGGEPSERE